MQVIPYLRIIWAGWILFLTSTSTLHDVKLADDDFVLAVGIYSLMIYGLTFSLYCLVIGLQELKIIKLIDAKYFEGFGIIAEVLTFLGGVYLSVVTITSQPTSWELGAVILWQTGLVILIIVDIKRLRAR